ncbi:DUF1064 domain-containing protein [Curvivirga aplysinae]|uniref:DUF1064 domain-containing protein n=1 Tax=Curvivirga aplysinae TaxID=2529852 RepID=UPI0012BC7F28|nr:DUF1064 domain-containing protein [Curvivirga aplysinae]MTI10206.1 DUF1064 domain-containing protein [Curvivirga aplysinae]
MKPRKYRNEPVIVHGVRYASRKEFRRHGDLKLLERAGQISDLKFQPKFKFELNGIKICEYWADYSYIESGANVVEDVKSPSTRKDKVYVLKKKLMKAFFNIDIREV